MQVESVATTTMEYERAGCFVELRYYLRCEYIWPVEYEVFLFQSALPGSDQVGLDGKEIVKYLTHEYMAR